MSDSLRDRAYASGIAYNAASKATADAYDVMVEAAKKLPEYEEVQKATAAYGAAAEKLAETKAFDEAQAIYKTAYDEFVAVNDEIANEGWSVEEQVALGRQIAIDSGLMTPDMDETISAMERQFSETS